MTEQEPEEEEEIEYADEPFQIRKDSPLFDLMMKQKKSLESVTSELYDKEINLDFRGIEFIFTNPEDSSRVGSQITDTEFDDDDYE